MQPRKLMKRMENQDPFDVFGQDDEDEEVDGNDIHEEKLSLQNDGMVSSCAEAQSKAQDLVILVNQRMIQKSSIQASLETKTIPKSIIDDTNAEKYRMLISHHKVVELPWDPPLYMGSILCVYSQQYGGGREYVAKQDLAPGTLILVEEPIIQWAENQIGAELGLVSVCNILEHADSQKIIHALEDFHPTKLAVEEFKSGDMQVKEIIETLESQLGEQLTVLVETAKMKILVNRNGSTMEARDMVRLLLCLRYNGFESGIYLHLAMLNHSCYPNSVKFFPTGSYSEVRTTRYVKCGEALTISYVPTIMSHASRRFHLWQQHIFDIGTNVPQDFRQLEEVQGEIPPSTNEVRNETSITTRIERTIASLEDHFHDLSTLLSGDNNPQNHAWEEAKALEVACLELYTGSREQLENRLHILLLPCLRLHLDVCEMIQIGNILSSSQQVSLFFRVLSSTLHLIELQTHLFGKDHFDLARSYNDLSQTISELLSRSPKQLVARGLKGFESLASCASEEYKARQEFCRIRNLFPKDAEQFIQKL
jgi:hypothetical protein